MDLVRRVGCEGEHPPIPRGTPRRFGRLLRACWHPDPSRRPSALRVVDALRKIQEELEAQQLSPPPPPPQQQQQQQRGGGDGGSLGRGSSCGGASDGASTVSRPGSLLGRTSPPASAPAPGQTLPSAPPPPPARLPSPIDLEGGGGGDIASGKGGGDAGACDEAALAADRARLQVTLNASAAADGDDDDSDEDDDASNPYLAPPSDASQGSAKPSTPIATAFSSRWGI